VQPPALAQVDQHAEERFDEARANPTPIGAQGNWVIVPIPVANPDIGNGLQLAALYLHRRSRAPRTRRAAPPGLVALGTDKGRAVFGGSSTTAATSRTATGLNVFAGSARFNLKFYGDRRAARRSPTTRCRTRWTAASPGARRHPHSPAPRASTPA
jgi:hypothetical protein